MARKKKSDTIFHNDKNIEKVIDFGDIKLPTKWEEETHRMLTDYLT